MIYSLNICEIRNESSHIHIHDFPCNYYIIILYHNKLNDSTLFNYISIPVAEKLPKFQSENILINMKFKAPPLNLTHHVLPLSHIFKVGPHTRGQNPILRLMETLKKCLVSSREVPPKTKGTAQQDQPQHRGLNCLSKNASTNCGQLGPSAAKMALGIIRPLTSPSNYSNTFLHHLYFPHKFPDYLPRR